MWGPRRGRRATWGIQVNSKQDRGGVNEGRSLRPSPHAQLVRTPWPALSARRTDLVSPTTPIDTRPASLVRSGTRSCSIKTQAIYISGQLILLGRKHPAWAMSRPLVAFPIATRFPSDQRRPLRPGRSDPVPRPSQGDLRDLLDRRTTRDIELAALADWSRRGLSRAKQTAPSSRTSRSWSARAPQPRLQPRRLPGRSSGCRFPSPDLSSRRQRNLDIDPSNVHRPSGRHRLPARAGRRNAAPAPWRRKSVAA